MNIHVSEAETRKRTARVGLAIADGDVHPALPNPKAIYPYLAKRWQDHLDTYGFIPRHQYQAGPAYPKGNPDAARRDAYPLDGGRPGSSLEFMRTQHLDPNNVELGILNPLAPTPGNSQNLDLAAALSTAMHEWQLAEWLEPGLVPRFPTAILSASIMVLAVLSLLSGFVLDSVRRTRHELQRLHYLATPWSTDPDEQ